MTLVWFGLVWFGLVWCVCALGIPWAVNQSIQQSIQQPINPTTNQQNHLRNLSDQKPFHSRCRFQMHHCTTNKPHKGTQAITRPSIHHMQAATKQPSQQVHDGLTQVKSRKPGSNGWSLCPATSWGHHQEGETHQATTERHTQIP